MHAVKHGSGSVIVRMRLEWFIQKTMTHSVLSITYFPVTWNHGNRTGKNNGNRAQKHNSRIGSRAYNKGNSMMRNFGVCNMGIDSLTM